MKNLSALATSEPIKPIIRKLKKEREINKDSKVNRKALRELKRSM